MNAHHDKQVSWQHYEELNASNVEMQAEIKALHDSLDALQHTIRGMEVQEERLKLENAKLRSEIDETLCVCEGLSTLQELRVGFINGISYRMEAEQLRKENAALLRWLESSDQWDDYNAIKQLQRELADVKAALDAARKEKP